MAAKKTTRTTTKSTTSRSQKTPAKKATSSVSTHSEETTPTHSVSRNSREKAPLRFTRGHVGILLGVLIVAALLYYFRSSFVAATVNGQPITRMALTKELERQAGKQAMSSLVTKSLIEQEAKKKNVSVSGSEIDTEIKKIQENLAKQGQKLDQVLQVQGMSMASLKDQIQLQKEVEKMLGKDISVSDKEVDDYIAANKESLPQDGSQADLKNNVKDRLKQTKLNDKVQTWLADLQKNAKVVKFVDF